MAKHSADNSGNSSANSRINDSANSSDKKGRNTGSCHHSLALTSPKQRQGSYFEQLACEFLQAQGLTLIAQNWNQPKVGELDLIMLETGKTWSTLVFIEVRQRRRSSFGDAALSVTAAKQRKLIKTAKYFLQHHPKYVNHDCRFDVVAYDINTSVSPINSDESKHDERQNVSYQPEWLAGAFIARAW